MKFNRKKILPFLPLTLLLASQSCRTTSGDSQISVATETSRVGILLASHGDIDNPDTELEDYIKTSFKKNVGIPLPAWSRDVLTGPAYSLSVSNVRKQYDIIGPTKYRENSEKQASAVREAIGKSGLNAKVYLGYNFTNPLIEKTMEQMQSDGIDTIVVINKGAQFSYASSGENMEDVLDYLNKHPEYNARVIGIRQYSDDPRFHTVMANAIEKDARKSFPGISPANICLMIGSHGLPQWLIDKGDPAVDQMRAAFKEISTKLKSYKTYHAFLNDDFVPGAKWVSPKASELAPTLKKDGCKFVLMDGRLSFTTHHRATLYDMNYDVRNILEATPVLPNGKTDPSWKKPQIVLAPNFDDDPDFAKLVVDITKEALEGKGHLVKLKEFGKPAKAKGSVGKPGVNPFE
jgi:ferrochelatase